MKSIKFLVCCILMSAVSISTAQKPDSLEYEAYKRILPMLMKGIKMKNDAQTTVESMVEKNDHIPYWELETFDQSDIDNMISILENNAEITLNPLTDSTASITIFCQLQDFDVNSKLRLEFQNLVPILSNINLTNQDGDNIYISTSTNLDKRSTDTEQYIILQGAQMYTKLVVKQNNASIQGTVDITIKEKQNFDYHVVTKNDISQAFEIANQSVALLDFYSNRATFSSPKKINDLKFVSTNADNKKHVTTSILQLPERIYRKALEENLTDEDVKNFVETYTYEECANENQPYITIYEASGEIDALSLFQATEEITKGSTTLNINL